jgi:hypothetical protein
MSRTARRRLVGWKNLVSGRQLTLSCAARLLEELAVEPLPDRGRIP